MPSDFDLLRPLDTEPSSPSTVDIPLAISAARRKRAIRGATYTGAVTLTVAAVTVGGLMIRSPGPATTPAQPAATTTTTATAVKAPASCTIERLPVPDGARAALVFGADPTGKFFVGRSYPKAGGYQAVIWHNGVAEEVPLPGDEEELLHDVNTSGTAVGWSYIGENTPMPFVFRDGKVTQLPGVSSGSAYAINRDGKIVGDDGAHPLLWSSPSAGPTQLPVPAGTQTAIATDIDDDGTVIGTLDNKVPYVWLPDGTHHALRLPDTDGKRFEGRLFHLRNGWAVGVANEAGGKSASGEKKAQGKVEAIRWNVRTGEMTVVGQFDKSADAVNAMGWQTGVGKQGGAKLLADEHLIALPGLAPAGGDRLADLANTLSDDGRTIGGQSDDANDNIQPVLWHCE
ncbi:hypothetical protein Acy02nite_17770 [Actinoplanes cyaneus]|uniref:Uncharacterized protein n=1 Tax=Actinoplanes cyaneus TaxID=52696 RepID=A0A919IGF1_9ACTN|nr:hypothetical protein [Actinoplanes cyaneus]MCW2136952.1 putative membrane protein [Actinoplanes cyaneus]GID63896.1 hypothetical protein Acy02nite_17770 [Actinoplanes cyaneus]